MSYSKLLVITMGLFFAVNNVSATPVTITNVETNGGYSTSSWVSDTLGAPYSHMIGIYEAASGHSYGNHPMFDAHIVVEDHGTNQLYLTLSSYEPVNWIFSGAGLSSIEGIIINGYYKHQITGLSDVTVHDKSGLGNYISSCVYTWPAASGGGCSAPTALTNYSEQVFGTALDSFTGRYSANGFLVREIAPTNDPNDPTDPNNPNYDIPEPAPLALLGLGLMGLGFMRKRKA